MSKKLLNERQIRRFQKLAEISSINEMDAEATDEAEELEEGGAAARVGNEDRDVGKGRMTPDRIREQEIGILPGEDKPAATLPPTKPGILPGEDKPGATLPPTTTPPDLDESQMRKLVSRIKARIMQENRHVQRLTHREQQIRLVEAQMARNVERNIAVQNRETLTEALIHRVVNRLKGSKR